MVSVRELFSASFECAALLVYFFVALSVSVLGRQIFAGILRGILILVGNGELAAAAAAGPDAANAASTEAQVRLVAVAAHCSQWPETTRCSTASAVTANPHPQFRSLA